ncbi:membrane dipeptidase [Hoylesella buccalis]|uniref:membrane dipeptidase n=1 Tax=Hoylesella buccalis TaxID=28127 RepID=UPI001D068FB9|nr:membrane dipeptidase [Hoylesella buccalis]MCB6901047.1 membrane dipeptidase [Hoylesella buccalis]UEA63643.1 membrane dipeptidase [Hoylesella buccalis]UWP49065.1 membrane dipeptidase [Hoylesella buccalis ATCC 35310]
MKQFDLNSHLNQIHSSYPAAHHRPLIGITTNYVDGDATLRNRYYKQVVDAGGTPMLIPPVSDPEVIINTLENIDGLLLTGGGDHNPLWAGEEPQKELHGINATRDLPELLITRLAFNRQIPMFGICRGMQTLAFALGGRVAQDINATLKHSQEADKSEPTHSVILSPESMIRDIYDSEHIFVNSFHHQAVSDTGPHFQATASSPDGIIEAMESTEHKSILGVQWHPEWLGDEGQKLFKWLVNRAGEFSMAKSLHHRHLILDTHCDTPMFFPQGIHFEQRDCRILVDLHKMTEGRQDAVIMVAYLPQNKPDKAFTDIAPFPVEGPKAYADLIFDKIEDIVQANHSYLALARNPEQLYQNKRQGKKSIVLGIENGLALEDDIRNVQHFANRGVTYITLCHNGDNDICDSARRSQNTHHGVSDFGEKVIKEMNDCGLMVDLSHGGEQSFYDALDISRVPIVCSHSNCKALCDVPRNLTDDQLRALAKAGGVAHTTFYHGFLRSDGATASIIDGINHLEHAIQIMGIDHVGIGTDFDGDGGVPGMANSSELINFTIQLLRRRYSEEDIAKIWGGNWLRVMRQVQEGKVK